MYTRINVSYIKLYPLGQIKIFKTPFHFIQNGGSCVVTGCKNEAYMYCRTCRTRGFEQYIFSLDSLIKKQITSQPRAELRKI